MYIVQVYVHVKPEFIDDFIRATITNAKNSIDEPGIARFDLLQQENEPGNFLLTEVYRSVSATLEHKQTQHYQLWRDRVAEMMVEPRTSAKYINIFPENGNW